MTPRYLQLAELPEDVALGRERFSPQYEQYLTPYPERPISIDALVEVMDECLRLFKGDTDDDHMASDRWLGPRLHAALRISRREATNPGLWPYLAAVAFPDYVQWRWGSARQAALSTIQDSKKHPFKRLWWTTEMFRNGVDYGTAETALARSDVANTAPSTRVLNNRAVALGALRYFEHHHLGSRRVPPVSTQLRTSAVTVALDTACPNFDESTEFDLEWLRGVPDGETTIQNPVGPKHGEVREEEIIHAFEVLNKVIDLKRVHAYRRGKGDDEPNPRGAG